MDQKVEFFQLPTFPQIFYENKSRARTSIWCYLDSADVLGLWGAGQRVAAHHAHTLQGRGEVEPLEDFEASIFAPPWNHRLSLNNQSVSYGL